MTIGYQSAVINGQLVPVAGEQSFSPLTYGATLSGPGYWPRGGQWNVPPLLPGASAMVGSTGYSPDLSESGGLTNSNQPVPTSGKVMGNGRVNWLHPTKSPTLWVLGLLALSLFLLHKVHYGK